MASIIKNLFASAGAAMTITLASLANGAGRGGTAIVNTSTLAISADIEVKLTTGSSGVSATGYAAIYLIRSADGSTYDDGFGGTDGAYTAVNATLLGLMQLVANSTTYVAIFDTAQLGITLPQKWSIGIMNFSGATLDATGGNQAVVYAEKQLQIV